MVSWNVRGLNDSRKRLVVRNLLLEWNFGVVCLQETKLAGMDRQLICSLWSCPYVDWVALDVDQTAGGVLMMWDRRALEKLEQLWEVPWSYIEDFNIVCFPSERLGGSRLTPAMKNFSEFIEELSLIDLLLEGGSYMWSSGSDQPSMSRIDRALVSHD
ncbi:hypothetical protein RGQ29_008522 [Quercus rubra]|uniref:Endonuclease/exonuclease/phosphatase domain-containing protein n=1 Tax=Quercus rubra TaxID=3512 RepID=A0AAN7I5C5_QUERU|nr:hypothetical protein RGQ29_008522 [Quercus rubra]